MLADYYDWCKAVCVVWGDEDHRAKIQRNEQLELASGYIAKDMEKEWLWQDDEKTKSRGQEAKAKRKLFRARAQQAWETAQKLWPEVAALVETIG